MESNEINGTREYSTYRVVTTSRLKAPRDLVVHDNLKPLQNTGNVLYTNYRVYFALLDIVHFDVIIFKWYHRRSKTIGSEGSLYSLNEIFMFKQILI